MKQAPYTGVRDADLSLKKNQTNKEILTLIVIVKLQQLNITKQYNTKWTEVGYIHFGTQQYQYQVHRVGLSYHYGHYMLYDYFRF